MYAIRSYYARVQGGRRRRGDLCAGRAPDLRQGRDERGGVARRAVTALVLCAVFSGTFYLSLWLRFEGQLGRNNFV